MPAPAQVGPVTTEQLEAMLALPSPADPAAEAPAASAPSSPAATAVAEPDVAPAEDEVVDDPYPALRAVRDELAEAGVEPRYLDPFIEGFRRNNLPFIADDSDVRDAVRRALSSRVPVARDWKGRPTGQALAFVGQSGVGKSTVVRKLTWRMHQAGMTVGIICAGAEVDSQVASLAERLDLTFTHAPDAEALAAARRDMSDVDILLIDTPGCSHMNLDEMEELGRLLSLTRVEEVHLVLPVAIPTADLGDLSRRFRIAGVNRLTLTKLDETRVHGNLLNVPLRLAKPLGRAVAQVAPALLSLVGAERGLPALRTHQAGRRLGTIDERTPREVRRDVLVEARHQRATSDGGGVRGRGSQLQALSRQRVVHRAQCRL